MKEFQLEAIGNSSMELLFVKTIMLLRRSKCWLGPALLSKERTKCTSYINNQTQNHELVVVKERVDSTIRLGVLTFRLWCCSLNERAVALHPNKKSIKMKMDVWLHPCLSIFHFFFLAFLTRLSKFWEM